MNEIRILIDKNFIQRHTNAKFTINLNNLLEKLFFKRVLIIFCCI